MRVLYVSNDSVLGGAAQSLIDMIERLQDKVLSVIVLPAKGEVFDYFVNKGIKCYVVPISRGIGYGIDRLNEKEEFDFKINYEAALSIKSIIKKEAIDLIHINSSVSNAGALGAILSDVPYIWHFRESSIAYGSSIFLDISLKKLLFQYMAKGIAISESIASLYNKYYNCKLKVIYDAVEKDRYFYPIESKVKKNHIFILAGILVTTKGQLDAVIAVKEIKEKYGINDIVLKLVGDRPHNEYSWIIRKYIDKYELWENVVIYPFMPDISEIRNEAEYALVTSQYEGLGRVTIEAMLAGCIVIGSDKGGTFEIIGETRTRGFLYKQGDVDSLVKCMLHAMGLSIEQKKRIREEAQKYALQTFDSDKYANEILELYKNVIKGGRVDYGNLKTQLNKRYELCHNMTPSEQVMNRRQTIERLWRTWDKVKDYKNRRVWNKKIVNKMIIYGMGKLGMRLYEECIENNIEIVGIVDQKKDYLKEVMDVIEMNDDLPETDIIVVTAFSEFEQIKENLAKKTDADIVDIRNWIIRS